MADIFLSYAREDRDLASRLASVLDGHGWSVWWDRQMLAGAFFDRVIEQQLELCRSVIVIWSTDSVSSQWVRNEAAVALEAGKLVSVAADAVRLPVQFRHVHTELLVGWNGRSDHPAIPKLVHDLEQYLGPSRHVDKGSNEREASAH